MIKSIRIIGMSALAAGLGLLAAPAVVRAQDSVFVTVTGDVGVGTTSPAASLHVSRSNGTAKIQVTDTSGTAASRTLVNLENNGQVKLRLKDTAQAPEWLVTGSNAFQIDNLGQVGVEVQVNPDGKVGIGTGSPVDKLHLFNSADAPTVFRIESTSSGANAVSNFRAQSDTVVTHFRAHGSGRTINHFGAVIGGWSEIVQDVGNGLLMGTLNSTPIILGTNNTNRFQIDGSTGAVTIAGNLTVNGTFSNPSSRELKENFAPLDPSTVLEKFAQLPINEWSYKSDEQRLRHVGPTVEDFRNAFGLGTEGQHIFPMDVQGVTMAAVQGLYQLVQEKDVQIADLQKELREIKQLLLEKGN